MKNTINLTLAAMLLSGLIACSEGKKSEEKDSATEEAKTEVAMNPVADHEMIEVVKSYFELKNALVETNGENSKEAATKMMEKVEALHPLGDMQASLKAITATDNVEEQRKHFQILSEMVYKRAKTIESKEFTIYKQYCPMAFGNTGTYWLSEEEIIANPYFGDKMLRCGKVQERL